MDNAATALNFVAPALGPALPEIFLLTMACLVLVLDVFLPDRLRHVTYGLVQLTLLGAALLTWIGHDGEPLLTFHGHYVKDTLGDVLKISLCLISAAVFLYSRDYLRERDLFKGEYLLLGLFGVLGMMVMVSAGSFLTVYLGLELFSLSTYALVAFHRDSPTASEAAMKYFVLGALASGMLLYGISMIYGATGTLQLQQVSATIAALGEAGGDTGNGLVLVFGLVFLVIGLAFKFGAVPFHMWLPDVYQGAPTAVTLYVGAAPKLAAFALMIRVLVDGMAPLAQDWGQMLAVLAGLSIAAGNLIAIAQTNIKRMLAYSTIAHVGFILLGVLAGNNEGYASALFYTITYALMTTGAFGVLLILSRNGVEAENISDLRGLNDRSPWLAFIMLLLMMSLAGIPFLVGFYAKLAVLQAVIRVDMVWLALLAVVFSVIGAFYYLRVVKTVYFDRDEAAAPVSAGLDTQVVISINGLLLIALGLYPTLLMSLCSAAFPG